MKLTEEDKEMLGGKQGNAVKKSMEILVALGEIFGAESLIPVTSVQISGVSYANLGDAGLEFLAAMASDGRVRVKTTLNPAGMDMENWKALGINEEFAEKQKKVIEAFERMGVETTCTCTPYLVGNKPNIGEHIAWGESSAVTYANSVLGAKTNKEGGPNTIASALTGRAAAYGLHLDENRQAQFVIENHAKISGPMLFGALGYVAGKLSKGRIPLLRGINKVSPEELKALSASIVTYGGTPLFHIERLTPNKTVIPDEKVAIHQNDIDKAIVEMNDTRDVDFIFIGCPHCSIAEIKELAELLKGKKMRKEFWIGIARPVKKISDQYGFSKVIEESGAKFACDTCHAVAPLKGRFKALATNSAKGVYYGRGQNKFQTFFGTMADCVKLAVE
ncbi:MAG: aconitase X catalytic domain-containing protein [Candidatus Bathyarchaeota archaeon]